MNEPLDKLKTLGGVLPLYITLGSVGLYVLGYLSVRFHLTALGVSTDLSMVDERYVFAGARFIIYFVSTIPSFFLICILLALVVWLPYRLLPKAARDWVVDGLAGMKRGMREWWFSGNRLAIAGIVFSVLAIQLVMRQAFFFTHLLISAEYARSPAWLQTIALDPSGSYLTLFYTGLVVLTGVSLTLLLGARKAEGCTPALRWMLGCLVVVQFLLLPINYGVFIIDKSLPRVSHLGDEKPMSEGKSAWLVWEGDKGKTFFVMAANRSQRSLVFVNQKAIKKIEITSFDPVMSLIPPLKPVKGRVAK